MPTRDKDDRPVNKESQAGELAADKADFERRRKIIKASAAVVPAILTIRSGAAAAMTSINQCEERDAAAAALLPEDMSVVTEADEWVRMEAWEVKVYLRGTNNPATVLYGVPESGVIPSLLGDYQVWYDEDGNTRANISPYKDYVDVVKQKEFDAGQSVFLMCYVDASAGLFNWYPQTPVVNMDQSASPITASCLCSVNPDFTMG